MKKTTRVLKKIIAISFSVTLVTLLVLTILSATGLPKTFRLFVVESGSMEPTIPKGSLVLVTPKQDYGSGDIITFITPPDDEDPGRYTVTHRIEDYSTDDGDIYFQTKGDANNVSDAWLINKLDVIGEVIFSVPVLGYIIGFIKTPVGFILVIALPSLLLIILESASIIKDIKKLKEKRGQLVTPVFYNQNQLQSG